MAPLIRMPLGVVASGWGKNTLDHFEGFGPCNGSEEQGVCLRTVGSGSFTHSCAIIKQTSGTAKTIDCQPSGEDINMMRFLSLLRSLAAWRSSGQNPAVWAEHDNCLDGCICFLLVLVLNEGVALDETSNRVDPSANVRCARGSKPSTPEALF